MNQQNVEALAAKIDALKDASSDEYPNRWWDSRTLAEALAKDGVLAVEALTDEQVDLAVDSGASEFDIIVRETHEIRAMLAKIARGEP